MKRVLEKDRNGDPHFLFRLSKEEILTIAKAGGLSPRVANRKWGEDLTKAVDMFIDDTRTYRRQPKTAEVRAKLQTIRARTRALLPSLGAAADLTPTRVPVIENWPVAV